MAIHGILVGGYVVSGYPMEDGKPITLQPQGDTICIIRAHRYLVRSCCHRYNMIPILVGPLVLPLYLLLVWIAVQLTLRLFVGLLDDPCYPSGTGWESSNSAILLVLLFVGP